MSKRALKKLKRFERIRKKDKERKVEDRGYSQDIFSETEYYFEDGLRKVYPYYFTFTTHAKERWFNKSLIEVFSKEFIAMNSENYRRHIERGKILVNGQKVKADLLLKNGDEICHKIHRHENPVIGSKIEIIIDTDDVLVINKPSSIPCHPCGKYRHNSIVFILGKEYGYANLRNIYRLDRLTSGVLILGKSVEATKRLEDQIRNREVLKEYVSRVVGKFPDGIVKVDEPLACMRHNLTLWRVQKGGKESQTSFERISYNGTSSVVRCTPHTGRTHQIRVHLQYLGYPIVNDPFYNSEAWGPSRGKGGIMERDEKDVVSAILQEHNVGQWVKGDNPLYKEKFGGMTNIGSTETGHSLSNEKSPEHQNVTGAENCELTKDIESGEFEPKTKKLKLSEENRFDKDQLSIDIDCEECQNTYKNPEPKDLILYLHAYKYEGPGWSYKASAPYWAADDWKN
ncbi:hypothetical protein LOTGIDRAFT_107992 [Lottia gigantea]|uniref:Pseudouridine synthase n=1 Tax=Lottia gigantea TaxID=225164 RepID=V4B6M9_LOTGI|nr:hypothetical protein LOTGIDRAFT_107992 [Lottia gigantea]ESO84214.1 hypothetical protein LOTGIDRAFT_107992 [Lottia gigantea]